MRDSDVDAAWRAFTDDDQQIEAPPRVRRAVMAAWDDAHRGNRRARTGKRYMPAVLVLAASLAAVVVGRGLREDAGWFDRGRSELEAVTAAEVAAPVGLATLAADATFETESLRVVRLRLPRTSLEVFGVALIEPDTSGLVDVDLLVGDDGLAREILRARPVLAVVTP